MWWWFGSVGWSGWIEREWIQAFFRSLFRVSKPLLWCRRTCATHEKLAAHMRKLRLDRCFTCGTVVLRCVWLLLLSAHVHDSTFRCILDYITHFFSLFFFILSCLSSFMSLFAFSIAAVPVSRQQQCWWVLFGWFLLHIFFSAIFSIFLQEVLLCQFKAISNGLIFVLPKQNSTCGWAREICDGTRYIFYTRAISTAKKKNKQHTVSQQEWLGKCYSGGREEKKNVCSMK